MGPHRSCSLELGADVSREPEVGDAVAAQVTIWSPVHREAELAALADAGLDAEGLDVTSSVICPAQRL